jgi:hypothetical protein
MSSDDFDRLIRRDWRVVKVYVACVACMVLVGLLAVVTGVFVWSEPVAQFGGVCLAAIGSVLPVREAWARLDRIIDLQMLRAKWLELGESPSSAPEDRARIESILWRLYGEV